MAECIVSFDHIEMYFHVYLWTSSHTHSQSLVVLSRKFQVFKSPSTLILLVNVRLPYQCCTGKLTSFLQPSTVRHEQPRDSTLYLLYVKDGSSSDVGSTLFSWLPISSTVLILSHDFLWHYGVGSDCYDKSSLIFETNGPTSTTHQSHVLQIILNRRHFSYLSYKQTNPRVLFYGLWPVECVVFW